MSTCPHLADTSAPVPPATTPDGCEECLAGEAWQWCYVDSQSGAGVAAR